MHEVFLDTETTGLSYRDGHKIVEIACIETLDLIPTGNIFHKLINPKRSIPEEAFKVHGFSEEFLRDELIVGFNGMLISWWLKPFTTKATTTEKGIALGAVFYNLSSKKWSEINDDFIKLSHEPTSESKRGFELANKLIDIVENINIEKWDSDEDITKAKQNEHMFENESKVFNLDNKSHNSGLIMSFFLLHIGEYIEKYRLTDR